MSVKINPNKSLGQHWLKDKEALEAMVKASNVTNKDTVLEVGPGLGTLTELLIKNARKVIAVEFDNVLANRLSNNIITNNFIVRNQDILKFDLGELPPDYKVAANIPYYLTGKLLRLFSDSPNKPKQMALLVQKEVAERLASKPGELSIIAVAIQLDFEVKLGRVVESELFTPQPKVDSQIVKFIRREKPLFKDLDKNNFMRIVKAGFANPRKKLRSSLSAGLAISKDDADKLLKNAKINGDLRAQNLTIKQWHGLYEASISFNS